MLLLTGSYYVSNFICLPDLFIPQCYFFFKLGAWRRAKTRTCLLHFSALKDKTLNSVNAAHYLRPVPDKR